MAARLRELYKTKVVPTLAKEFSYKNTMAVPKIEKIVVSMGVSTATSKADNRATCRALRKATLNTTTFTTTWPP